MNVEDISSVKHRKIQPLVSFISHSKSVCMLKHFSNCDNKYKNMNKFKEKETGDEIDKEVNIKDVKTNEKNNNLKTKDPKELKKDNTKNNYTNKDNKDDLAKEN